MAQCIVVLISLFYQETILNVKVVFPVGDRKRLVICVVFLLANRVFSFNFNITMSSCQIYKANTNCRRFNILTLTKTMSQQQRGQHFRQSCFEVFRFGRSVKV